MPSQSRPLPTLLLCLCMAAGWLVAAPAFATTPIFRVKALLDKSEVLISAGAADGVEAGDVLFVHDNTQNLGRLTVSRVAEREAYALITHESHPGAIQVGQNVEFEPIREKAVDPTKRPVGPGRPLSSPVREAETLILGARYSPTKQQEIDERIRNLKRHINLGGEDPRLYVELGEAYLLKNEIETAINWLKQGVKLDERSDYVVRGLYRIAQAYVLSGRNDRAVRYLNFIAANYPNTAYNKTLNQTAREAREMFETYSLAQALLEPETRLERSAPSAFATGGMVRKSVPGGEAPEVKEEEPRKEEPKAEATPKEEPKKEEKKPEPVKPQRRTLGDKEEHVNMLALASEPSMRGFTGLYHTPTGVVRPSVQLKAGINRADSDVRGVQRDDKSQVIGLSFAAGDNVELGITRYDLDQTITTAAGVAKLNGDYNVIGGKYLGGVSERKRSRYGFAASHASQKVAVVGGGTQDFSETTYYAFGRWAQDRTMLHAGLTYINGDNVVTGAQKNKRNVGFFGSYAAMFGDKTLGFVEFITDDANDSLNVGLRYRMNDSFTLQAVLADLLDNERNEYFVGINYAFGGPKSLSKLAENEGL